MKKASDLSDVISATLKAEYGHEVCATIGLFHQHEPLPSDLAAAQQVFVDMLVRVVEQAALDDTSEGVIEGVIEGAIQGAIEGVRILVAGSALGKVASTLGKRCPNLIKVTDKLPAAHPQRFNILLLVGTYCYLDQLSILARCRELLLPGGTLFLCGEYLDDDSRIEFSSIASLGSLRQLAERLGFQKIETWDLSDSASHSVNLFLPLLEKHAAIIQESAGVDAAALTSCAQILSVMRDELKSGRRVYRLLQWRFPGIAGAAQHLDQLGEYPLAEYGDIHSFAVPEIKNLFEQSFEKAFDPALWHWKYQMGNGKCIVARTDRHGEIVAHYGGVPRNILYFGVPSMAIQVCDVMVLPEQRRQYGKSSLFFKVAATFLEREIGNTVQHLLGFGFPNQSAMNIATRLGLYEKTDDFVEIVFAAGYTGDALAQATEFDATSAWHIKQVEQLWQEMAPEFSSGIIGMRDAGYIRYRYAEHPGAARNQYRCLLLREVATAGVFAFIVLKTHGESQLLMDMVCASSRIPDVINAANQLVKSEQSGKDLRLWLTRGWLHSIPLEGAIVNELNIEIPCNSWNPGPAAADLYGKWWLTAGDMDFM